ncbi:TPA: hypothetical protein ACVU5F_004604 [Vibrio parahaemolyticus]
MKKNTINWWSIIFVSCILLGCNDHDDEHSPQPNVIDDTQVVSQLNIEQEPVTIEGHGMLIIE